MQKDTANDDLPIRLQDHCANRISVTTLWAGAGIKTRIDSPIGIEACNVGACNIADAVESTSDEQLAIGLNYECSYGLVEYNVVRVVETSVRVQSDDSIQSEGTGRNDLAVGLEGHSIACNEGRWREA